VRPARMVRVVVLKAKRRMVGVLGDLSHRHWPRRSRQRSAALL
jgi:hypothetical protein